MDINLSQLKISLNMTPSKKMVVSERSRERSVNEKQEFVKDLLLKLQDLDKGESLLHLEMVGRVSAFLSEKMGKKKDEIKEIELFAKLHDIGKVGIPEDILNKPGKLTDAEYEIVKTHTEIGYQLVKGMEISKLGLDIIRYHHEKWDGTGYSGLRGEEIPQAARIIAVADVYDALRMKRSYKEPMSHEDAVAIIFKDSGIHFDPAIVDIFLKSHQEIRNIYNTFLN